MLRGCGDCGLDYDTKDGEHRCPSTCDGFGTAWMEASYEDSTGRTVDYDQAAVCAGCCKCR